MGSEGRLMIDLDRGQRWFRDGEDSERSEHWVQSNRPIDGGRTGVDGRLRRVELVR
jgi:hypothetical protein